MVMKCDGTGGMGWGFFPILPAYCIQIQVLCLVLCSTVGKVGGTTDPGGAGARPGFRFGARDGS
jgi:hypothetical protein